MRRTWSIITPEYPPASGGIGDYTELVARRLAERGDHVTVFTRSPPGRSVARDVHVVLLPDDFGAATRRVLTAVWERAPKDTVALVQYVPRGFRLLGMNVPFAAWLGARPERRFLMLHEAVYPFSRSDAPKRWILVAATRLMLHLLARSAERVFVSTPAWELFAESWGRAPRRPEWLPIPATLHAAPESLLTESEPPGQNSMPTVAHFGTYGALITNLLEPMFSMVLARRPEVNIRLLGRGAPSFAQKLVAREPDARARVDAIDADIGQIARELSRASVVVLPFIEGVTTRRTSLMNALAVGAAIVTTEGGYSERFWRDSGAVALYPYDRPELAIPAIERLLDDAGARAEQRRRALVLYRERFHLEHVVDRLQAAYDAKTQG